MRIADTSFTTVLAMDCISLWLGSMIYGCHVVVLAACFYILLRGRLSNLHKCLLYINVASFVFATAQIVVAFLAVFLVVTLSQGKPLDYQLAAINAYNVLDALSDALIPTTNIIADSLLIWRCYVVWGRRLWVVALPIILLIIGTVCGYILAYAEVAAYLIRLHQSPTDFSTTPAFNRLGYLVQYMNIGYYASSLATNVLMSALIAYRIFVAARGVLTHSGKSYHQKYTRIASIIIETGAVYSTCLLLAFILKGPVPIPVGYVLGTLVALSASIFPALFTLLFSLNVITEDGSRGTDNPTVPPLEFAMPQISDQGRSVAQSDNAIGAELIRISHPECSGAIRLGTQADLVHKG